MSERATAPIRDALTAGEFTRAERLWRDYAGKLEAAVRAGTATQAMMAEAGELVEWARMVGKAFRAHTTHRLDCLRVAEIYASRFSAPARFLRTSG